jgi:nitroreductase/NAD-dependent dihydropyrimidine dehydrogenase PreA subunit
MNWISIDQDKCNQCGLCVTRCQYCYSDNDGEIAGQADEVTCNLCGHCVSLCPTDAIDHQMMNMDNFPPAGKQVQFDADDFIAFLRRRRSHRHFKNKAIPRATLETLVDICRYAPTGSNRQQVEIRIMEDPDRIKRFSDLTVDYFASLIQNLDDQVDALKAGGKEIPKELESLHANMVRYKPLTLGREAGMDVVFRAAPCVMVFHSSPQRATTPKDDCVIAAQTVSMLAMTMKLETCYIGLFNAAANVHPPIMEELQLPDDNKVYSVLILGYPKFKYLRAVDRKPIRVTWE